MKESHDSSSLLRDLAPGSRVLVVGLGATGLSCVRYLRRHGFSVMVIDSRESPPALSAFKEEFPEVPLRLGGFAPGPFQGADWIVVSPGVSLAEPEIVAARERGAVVTGDVELFAQAATAPILAVTGSNGKSTVVTLVAEMAAGAGIEVRAGGNLGTPVLDLLQDREPELYVLELSSFQLESTFGLHARAAVVLNVCPDHLDRYAGIAGYAAAKGRIYHHADVCIVNVDDPIAASLAHGLSPQVRYGLGQETAVDYGLKQRDGADWLVSGDDWLMPAAALRLQGRHNLSNALAALALGREAGIPLAAMRKVLGRFQGLSHRMQWVAERDGVRWYNDSKATNTGATVAALEGFDRPVVLIAGGDGKGADFTPLALAARDRVRAAVVLGRDAPRVREALEDVVPVVGAGDLEEAVAHAARLAQPGDAVLLSPACASLDMFTGYEERGDVFTAAVRRHLGS